MQRIIRIHHRAKQIEASSHTQSQSNNLSHTFCLHLHFRLQIKKSKNRFVRRISNHFSKRQNSRNRHKANRGKQKNVCLHFVWLNRPITRTSWHELFSNVIELSLKDTFSVCKLDSIFFQQFIHFSFVSDSTGC